MDRDVTTEVDSDDDLDIVVERIGSKFALNLFLINRGGGHMSLVGAERVP